MATGYAADALDRWAGQARGWAAGGRDLFLFLIDGGKVNAPAGAMALIARLDGGGA